MSIKLGGIDIPDLVADPDFGLGDSGIRSAFVESRGSVPIIWEQEKFFRIFDLVGGERTGWIDYSTLMNLMDLAKGQLDAAASYDLTYAISYTVLGSDGLPQDAIRNKTIKVRFRNWEQPVIEATPLVDVLVPVGETLYNNVRIKLIELIDTV